MPTEQHPASDIVGEKTWDDVWASQPLPDPFNPADPHLRWRLYPYRRRHEMFRRFLGPGSRAGQRIVEIGCARSIWLPYFAREYGFQPCGIDYSETGCVQSRAILEKCGLSGDIECADFFHPPARFLGSADVVVSFGVIEHFKDTASVVSAFTRYLKPGGIMLTDVPNMPGMVGTLQKIVNRPVYDGHVLITADDVRHAHERAGLDILHCEYLLFSGFNVCSPPYPGQRWFWPKYLLRGALVKMSQALWPLDRHLPASHALSPLILCVARKPAS